jgi:hypothetical protein
VRLQVTQQAFIFVHRLCWIRAITDTAALATTDTSAAMPVSSAIQSHLRLGLGLGLFLPAHFFKQGPLRFWVAGAGRAAGQAARW